MLQRFRAWVRSLIERSFNRYAEGPDPPTRYAQAVLAFAAMYPKATQADWIRFAAEHAHEAYRAGYLRGVEWKARKPELVDPAWEVAKAEMDKRHEWSWIDLAPAEEQLAKIVAEYPDQIDLLSPEQRIYYMDRLGEEMGGFRVELFTDEDPKV